MFQLNERLSYVMQELNLNSRSELAEFCGVTESLVTQWFSGQTRLGAKPLKALAKTRFNIEWIADGRLPKFRCEFEDQGTKQKLVNSGVEQLALIYATDREIALLTAFRESSKFGQLEIERLCKAFQSKAQ